MPYSYVFNDVVVSSDELSEKISLGALAAYERGITVAETKGDIQAAKEMTVFAKRIRKALAEQNG